MRLRCQVGASWTHEERTAGLCFFLDKGDRTILMGLRNCSEITLPLQAEEAEGLIWAMKKMLGEGHTSVRFESDCAQLVKLIHKVEEWPAMVETIEDISYVSLGFLRLTNLDCVNSGSHIEYLPRGLNKRADCLAKAARARQDHFSLI
ncbi:unnamed protein product, partial [Brassica oleracea]